MEMFGYLALRFIFGLIFILHGCQHVFANFGGGKGMKGSEDTVGRLGFKPVWLWSRLFAAGMLGGGFSVFFGAVTQLGAATLISIMAVAILANKLPRGFWNKNNGYEYNLSLIGGLSAVGLFGPGPLSLDGMFGLPVVNPGLFVVALIFALAVASVGFMTREPAGQPARD
jgi:uncharacterized membrane protein YphA (DoxX/SURF4 family)